MSKFNKDFLSLMKELCENLTQENLLMIKYLCRDLIPVGKQLPTPRSLILYLEDHKFICKEDLSFLAEIIYRINRHDLLKKFPGIRNRRDYEENFFRKNSSLRFTSFRLTCFQLINELTNDDLNLLKYITRHLISGYNYQKCDNVIMFLICLEEEDLLSEDNLEYLKDILGQLDNQKPYQIINQLLLASKKTFTTKELVEDQNDKVFSDANINPQKHQVDSEQDDEEMRKH